MNKNTTHSSNNSLEQDLLQQRELQKLNLNVYFKTDIPETDVKTLVSSIQKQFADITVDYRTAEESLALWVEKNADDKVAMQAMEELGTNPLGAELKITTNSSEQTKSVAYYIELLDKNEIIDGLNYTVH